MLIRQQTASKLSTVHESKAPSMSVSGLAAAAPPPVPQRPPSLQRSGSDNAINRVGEASVSQSMSLSALRVDGQDSGERRKKKKPKTPRGDDDDRRSAQPRSGRVAALPEDGHENLFRMRDDSIRLPAAPPPAGSQPPAGGNGSGNPNEQCLLM